MAIKLYAGYLKMIEDEIPSDVVDSISSTTESLCWILSQNLTNL